MITLYTTTSKDNELDKTLTNPVNVESGKIRDSELDVLRPQFLIKTSELQGNYLYISELNRYYFIDSTTQIDNVHTQVNCRCDVLMSWKPDILNATALCISRTNGDRYYPSFETNCKRSIQRLTFQNTGFNTDGVYTLTTVLVEE